MLYFRDSIKIFGLLYCLQVVITALPASGTNGVRCFSCDGVMAPDECTRMIKCGADELCYLEKYIRQSDFKQVYRGGCRHRSVCNLQTCLQNRALPGRRRDVSIGTICSECCNVENCNIKLCGFDKLQTTSELDRCYQCDNLLSPDSCMFSTFCETNEQCGISMYYSIKFGKINYRSGCFRRAECEALGSQDGNNPAQVGKRLDRLSASDVQLKSICCNDTLCNDFDPIHGLSEPNGPQTIIALENTVFLTAVNDADEKYVFNEFDCPTTPFSTSTTTPKTVFTTPITIAATKPTDNAATAVKFVSPKPAAPSM